MGYAAMAFSIQTQRRGLQLRDERTVVAGLGQTRFQRDHEIDGEHGLVVYLVRQASAHWGFPVN
jgi:hypothetical protein